MNTLRNISGKPARLASQPAAGFLGCKHGRSPAYRRLSSCRIPIPAREANNPRLLMPIFTHTLPPLRSPLYPTPARLRAIRPAVSRSFHASRHTHQHQQQDPRTTKTPPSQDPTEDAGSKSAKTDPKTEDKSARAGADGDSKGQDSSEDGEGGRQGGESKAGEDGKQEHGKKEDMPPPPPHGDKTPWQVFMDTMKSELKESKEWNESTKALASSAHQFTESESLRRARQAYEVTSGAVSSTAARAVKSTAGAIGKGATWTWETPVMKGVRKGANITGEALDKATKPIRETEAYKNVKNVIDDGSSSRYGGWVEKDERKRRRELWEQSENGGKPGQIAQEDPEAGTNVTLHKDARWKEAWRDFRDSSKVMQGIFGMKSVYQESENPLISTARSITDRVAGFFAENETALVIKKLRSMDPTFQVEPFLRELREYMLPEVLDAYVKGDLETLRMWLSEAQFSVYEALTKQYMQAGLKSDGRILDIRHVDILKARMLEPGEIPVFIITCRTQEVHVYRNAKTNQLAAGMEDKVQLVTYAIGMTRIAEDVSNPETRGWRLMEMQKSGRDYY